MNPLWFWDNVRLSKTERSQLIFVNCILAFFILMKMAMVFLYSPTPIEVDREILASIEMSEPAYDKPLRRSNDTYAKNASRAEHPSSETKPIVTKKRRSTPDKSKKHAGSKAIVQLFSFDPNSISRDSLKMLGLSRYTINSLLKYRSKGGKIKSKDQFSKFNGLDEETLVRILPLVSLPSRSKKKTLTTEKKAKYVKKDSSITNTYKKYKKKTPRVIDINVADTTDFQNLYGIGSVYSKRIIKYRDYVGGFFAIDQINEVWGIDDSLYNTLVPYLKVDHSSIAKRDINLISSKDLGKHPYVGWDKAKHIINFRDTHGSYKAMNDLLRLHTLTEEDVDTLKIYFDVK